MKWGHRWLLWGTLTLGSAEGLAHELRLFAMQEGSEISGRVYFEGGDGLPGVVVLVRSADNEVLGEVMTGREGRFRFRTTRPGEHLLHARTRDLHEADSRVQIMPTEGAETASASSREAELEREVARLREELDRREHSPGWRDLLGGVGLILGFFAALMFWKRAKS
jgi:hypothetical protein